MSSKPQQQKGRDGALSLLNATIEALNLAKEVSTITPARAVFGSVSILLTVIRDTLLNDQECVELGLSCADVCQALERGLNGRRLDELNKSVLAAVEYLTTTVAEIQKKIIKRGKRHPAFRLFHAKSDKDAITGWRQDLIRVLLVFGTELTINIHTIVEDIRRKVSTAQEGTPIQRTSTLASVPPGELPPPPPRACFGRDELIKEIVGLIENIEPVALIGAGGIGKTSIALNVLHHDSIKDRFGGNRRFIRCDQFPPSLSHFLARLSKVIGAGIENPEDLASLRSFLSSREMILFLDNAESILDPQGTDAREIYSVVEELSRFSNISLCITSRISTVPPHCNRPTIPTLSAESAADIFYGIYKNSGRSHVVSDLVQQMDFHPLSITLLATAAAHNMWGYDRLAKEWGEHRAQVLQTDYNESLAATIELSLASPTFRSLGPIARELLGVIASLPQGIDEKNLDWLFPTILDRKGIFDKFCVLSLTYRSNGFVTMLAPLRDYFHPRDPRSSPLLAATKDRYFGRLINDLQSHKPGFGEAQWIKSEDVNVEHLLDVFTSADIDSGDTWDACVNFIRHLYWYKPRPTVLETRIKELPDCHPSKPQCLSELALLSETLGNDMERKRLLTRALELGSLRVSDVQLAHILAGLGDSNRVLRHYEEGTQQLKEALEIYERIGDTEGQAWCLNCLALLLVEDGKLEAAEETASCTINLPPDQNNRIWICEAHRLLGDICHSRGEREKAFHHFQVALEAASSSNWPNQLFWIHRSLAILFRDKNEFDDAHAHINQAKSRAVDDPYCLGRAMETHAGFWYLQSRLDEAITEALCALETFEKLGATSELERCRNFLCEMEEATEGHLS